MSPHHQALKSGILSSQGSKLNTNCECITPRGQTNLCLQDPTLMLLQRSQDSFCVSNSGICFFLKQKTKTLPPKNKTKQNKPTVPSLSPPLLPASVNFSVNVVKRVQEYWRKTAVLEEQWMSLVFTQNYIYHFGTHWKNKTPKLLTGFFKTN